MTKTIAQVIVGLPVAGPFDYSIPPLWQGRVEIGMRVKVDFAGRSTVGYVIDLLETSPFEKIKPILNVLDNVPSLNPAMLALSSQVSDRYVCAWGEVAELCVPAVMRRPRVWQGEAIRPEAPPPGERPVLVHDPSGRKYLEELKGWMRETPTGMLILVPEASAVKPWAEFIKKNFPERRVLAMIHETPKEEFLQWSAVKDGKVDVVVGTRSSVFAPLSVCGLILMIEEENQAYRQEQSPAYHAREVALLRAAIERTRLVFVSGAPTAELWFQAQNGIIDKRRLERPEPGAKVQMIDLSNYESKGRQLISPPLLNTLDDVLKNKKRAILFMNRLGFSTWTKCFQCGFILKCPRCSSNLVFLSSKSRMICRHCSHTEAVPKQCPKCRKDYLKFYGTGIEKVVGQLKKLFPGAAIASFDKESKSIVRQFDILVATQAILKLRGRLTVESIGVLDIDAEFSRLDYRCGQQTFAKLVGLKSMASEKMVVQTHNLDNYWFKALVADDFDYFYREELRLRQEVGLPPFRHIVNLVVRSKDQKLAYQQALDLFELLAQEIPENSEIHPPHADIIEKLRDQYRYIIMMRSSQVEPLGRFIKERLPRFKKKKDVIVTCVVDG